MFTLGILFNLFIILPEVWVLQDTTESSIPRKPVIYEAPVDTFASDGVLEFTCQAEGYPKPTITWFDALTGEKVIDRVPSSGATAGIHVNQHYGRLMVSNPLRNKIYSFYCNASNSAGWSVSHPPVKGGLAYMETAFRQNPSDKTVHQGDRVLLDCLPPVGLPEPKVAWYRQGILLAAQPGFPWPSNVTTEEVPHARLMESGSLQISAATLTDSGDYVCVAANVAGQHQSVPAHLSVKPRARFLETPTDIRVRRGENAKFTCRVEGNQMVKWSRGPGEGMIDSSRIELADGYLVLKNVQLSDAGVYVCTAPGSIVADATLTVETPPTFSRTPDDLTVRVGQTARFHCITTGYPQPSIYWELPDKTPVFPSDDISNQETHNRFYLHKDGTLEIQKVEESDAGKYQCTAHSSIDRVHSSALLHVLPRINTVQDSSHGTVSIGHAAVADTVISHSRSPYEFYPLAPVIGLPPANQTRLVGDLVILDCELGATRYPISASTNLQIGTGKVSPNQGSDWSVTWQRSTLATEGIFEQLDFSRFVHEQRYSLLPGGSLQIVNAQLTDTGIYTCSAQSWFHPDRQSAEQKSSIHLQSNWTAHLNVLPVGSAVRPDSERENPLSPPRELHVTNVTESTITLAWEPSNWLEPISNSVNSVSNTDPLSRGVVTYWVEYYRPDRAVEGWRTVEQNWPASTVQIGGLQPSTAYYFLIRPRWQFGRVGWASAPLGPVFTEPRRSSQSMISHTGFFPDNELLQSVRNVEVTRVYLYPISPRRMRVSWTVHEHPTVLQLITSYTIYYRKTNLMHCIPDGVQAVDNHGVHTELGDSYCSLRFTTDRGQMNVYRELQHLQRQRQHLTSSLMDTPLQVDVKAKYLMDASNALHSGPAVYEGSGLLRDLDPFQCYEVRVKPHSTDPLFGNTEGRESLAYTALTFDSFPSLAPERVAAQWTGPSEVSLSWSPPPASHWNGILQGYTIYFYDELAREHQTFNVSSGDHTTVIKGLTSSSAYLIQMAASTCKGVGLRNKPLRLDPSLHGQIGRGVGWGYDSKTGLPVSVSDSLVRDENDNDSGGSARLIHKPWFIGTMVSSLLLWFALIGLITFCCRRQPYVFRKTAGGVLIANTSSNCGTITGNGINGTLAEGSGTAQASGNTSALSRYGGDKNSLLQMEPLIQKSAPVKPGETNELDGSLNNAAYTSNNPFLSSPESSAATTYGLYSFTHNTDLLRTQWGGRPTDLHNPPNQGTSTGYALQDDVGVPYATANNSVIGHGNSARTDSLPPNIQTNPVIFHPTGHLVNYPMNICPPNSTPAYLTYQPGMIHLSQSISEFPTPDMTRDQGYGKSVIPSSNAVPASTGLPPIAPVAQLRQNGTQLSPPSAIENLGSVASVAPYATASIIQNSMMTERNRASADVGCRSNLNTMGVLNVVNGISSESPGMMDRTSYSSGDSNRSYSNNSDNGRAPRDNPLVYGRGDTYMNSVYPAQEARGRASTPGKSPNPLLPSRAIPSNPSKSESNASTSTRLSGGFSVGDRSAIWPNSPSTVGKLVTLDAADLSISGYQPTQEEDVYSLADDNGIPPPPASPPPPAPMLGREKTGNTQAADVYRSSRSAARQANDVNQSIYDMNAETSEDEAVINGHALPSSTYLGSMKQHRLKARSTKREENGAAKSGFCARRPTEEAQNTTYAQVY